MKSLKINPAKHSPHQNKPIHSKLQYDQFFSIKLNPSVRQKLAALLAFICNFIEDKTPLKLNLQSNIKKWVQKVQDEDEDGQILEEFKIFLIQSIENLVRNNEKWQKSEDRQQSRVIRIKSEERIKLRLLKQNQSVSGQLWQTDQQKESQAKQKQIYELKNANKKLQRKIVLLSAQFNQIKKNYEAKIQKYKRLLYNSLIQLQEQVGEDLGQFAERQQGYRHVKREKSIQQHGEQIVVSNNLRSVKSEQFKKYEFGSNNQRRTAQEQDEYRVGNMEKEWKRLSHKNYGSG